jgi:hypothetical protein
MQGNGKLINLAYNVLRRGGVYGDEEVVYPDNQTSAVPDNGHGM